MQIKNNYIFMQIKAYLCRSYNNFGKCLQAELRRMLFKQNTLDRRLGQQVRAKSALTRAVYLGAGKTPERIAANKFD